MSCPRCSSLRPRPALLRLSRKEYDGAVADYTKAIDLKPQDADGYIGRGNAYFDTRFSAPCTSLKSIGLRLAA